MLSRPHFQRLASDARLLPPLAAAVVHPCDAESLQCALSGAFAGYLAPVLVGTDRAHPRRRRRRRPRRVAPPRRRRRGRPARIVPRRHRARRLRRGQGPDPGRAADRRPAGADRGARAGPARRAPPVARPRAGPPRARQAAARGRRAAQPQSEPRRQGGHPAQHVRVRDGAGHQGTPRRGARGRRRRLAGVPVDGGCRSAAIDGGRGVVRHGAGRRPADGGQRPGAGSRAGERCACRGARTGSTCCSRRTWSRRPCWSARSRRSPAAWPRAWCSAPASRSSPPHASTAPKCGWRPACWRRWSPPPAAPGVAPRAVATPAPVAGSVTA